jgi:hypothetical protein
MDNMLDIFNKKKKVSGTLNINLNDRVEGITKNFQISTNSSYYDKNSVHVELTSKIGNINIENGYTANIIVVINKKIILSKNIDNLTNDFYDIKKIFNNNSKITCGFITYYVNSTRNILIFCRDNDNTISNLLKGDNFKFKDITNDFEYESLLYELYVKIIKLLN